jgi:hypothetical protein
VDAKLNTSSAVKHIRDAKARIIAELGRLAKEAELEALNKGHWALHLNVYGTEPGFRYVRTGLLNSSLFAGSSVLGGVLTITLGDSAEYARRVNYGDPEISPAAAEQIAKQYGPNLIKTGRSGKKYMLPASYIEPALYIAGEKLLLELSQVFKTALGVK